MVALVGGLLERKTRGGSIIAIDNGSLGQPHNNLMLAILASPARAGSLLRASLEPWIVERLTDDLPKPLEGSFIDDELRATRSDKLFLVRFKDGRPGFVYVLLEHKSYSDPGTALQVAKYKTRIWEAYAQGLASRLKALPAIIPQVLYHGREPWTAPMSLADMLADEDERVRALESSFGYYLLDLGRTPIEDLAVDAETRAGLVALRYSHAAGQADRLAALEGVLAGLPDGSEYERKVVVYILNIWRMPVPEVMAAAGRAKPGRGERIVGEIVQELIDIGRAEGRAEAKAEGRAEGRAEGIVEGRAEGTANTLMKLLKHRFGSLPETARRQIRDASLVQLQVWFSAALSGHSLAEVLAIPASD